MSVSRCSVRLSGPLDAVIFPISDGYVWVALRWLWSLTFCNLFFEALQSAAKSYLKDLPFYVSPTFIFKDLSRVYLPVIQVSSFCSLSEIYTGCKYNDVKSEKNIIIWFTKETVMCIYHTEDSWELSKCITLSMCPSAPQHEAPWLAWSAFSAFCRKLWFLSHPII